MDEEKNNGEQNEAEKVQQEIQDTANMAKNSANLAKNAATGNVLGAIKDGLNLLKNKKFRRKLILQMVSPFITIILAGALLLGVFNAVGDTVQNIVDKIVDFFTIDSDGAIVINEEQVDTIINSISNLGVSIDGLKLLGDVDYSNPDIQAENQKALRKYIKEFYEAQAMTQTLNTKPGWIEENILNGGKPYGTVYVHRTLNGEDTIDASTKTYQLGYISYEDMVKKQEAGDKNITKYFSINENGELVIAGWTDVVVKRDGVKDNDASRKIITLKNINYKNVISQYTTSMNFFLYLTMISQNPEFVSAVTDLVKNSDIRLTVLDTNSKSVNTETYTYIENTKTKTKVETTSYDAWDTQQQYPYTVTTLEENTSSEEKTEVVETTTTSVIPTIKVTYAKTWFCEQTITYNKKQEDTTNTNTETEEDEEEPELTEEGSVTWKTNQSRKYDSTSNVTKYEEGTRGDVIDRTGEKGSQGIKDKNGNGKVDGNEIVDENSTFLGLLDNKFKIPNTTRYDSAGGNVVSGAEMFFYLLQKDYASQNLEQIMRYILYKYTGRDYGVTELDFSIYDARDFISIGGSIYGSNAEEKVWFALREAGYSEYAVAGVLGNIYAESGFEPSKIEGDTGIGYGLCQWSYGRRTQLEAYATSKGKPASDVDTQIEFLLTEITPGANGPAQGYADYQMLYYNGYNGSMWENADSPENAAIAFCWSFERPGEPRINVRTQKAREYYEKFKGMTKPSFAGDTVAGGGYTFPHYYQRDYPGSYGTSTIPAAGCGPTSLAMILAGLKGDPSIDPQTVVENIKNYWPSGSYYVNGVGSSHCIFRSDFLQKYYGVTSEVSYPSESQAIAALESGCAVIGGEDGHILAIIPVPDEYKSQGYKFYILDSARGHDGPYRSVAEANRVVKGSLRFIAIIRP